MGGLKTFLKKWGNDLKKEDGWDKVAQNLPSARPGTRAWPPQSNSSDHKISSRLDYGPLFVDPKDGVEKRQLVLQPNKGAKDRMMAKMAKADPHQKIATINVPVDNPPTVEEFMNELGKGLA